MFLERLKKLNSSSENRKWVYVAYDQLSDQIGILSEEQPINTSIILIESREHADRRPYHKQRLLLNWANQRHFALEQAKKGVYVDYIITDDSISSALEKTISRVGIIQVMEPAEYELREELQSLVSDGKIIYKQHNGWLTQPDDLISACPNNQYRMDSFYRYIRKKTDILMENGKPVGGKYSFDTENRLPWKGNPPAPIYPTFFVDDIKIEVENIIETQFADHPGEIDISNIPATLDDIEKLCSWAKSECLPYFGPYEDAMSSKSSGLFHTKISAILNMHRITPKKIIDDVINLDIPLASKEAFIRQVLGKRSRRRVVHLHR
ncbi:MAG: cryptochrome/photolyase family protein [Armatimonadota bacterium]